MVIIQNYDGGGDKKWPCPEEEQRTPETAAIPELCIRVSWWDDTKLFQNNHYLL